MNTTRLVLVIASTNPLNRKQTRTGVIQPCANSTPISSDSRPLMMSLLITALRSPTLSQINRISDARATAGFHLAILAKGPQDIPLLLQVAILIEIENRRGG